MPANTTTYNFFLPTVGGDTNLWGGYLNSNWDGVDDLFDGTTPVDGIDIDGGSIDGTPIGAATPSTGVFTTISVTTLTIAGVTTFSAEPVVDVESATTNDGIPLLTLRAQSSGTPAAGIAGRVDWEVETAGGNVEGGAAMEAVAVDVTAAAEVFAFDLYLMTGGALSSGDFRFHPAGLRIGDITTPTLGLEVATTDAILLPTGTTAQRPAGTTAGRFRYNSTTDQFEGYTTADGWGRVGGGAALFKGDNGETGDTTDGAGDIFRVHNQILTVNTTIDATENALCAGPLEIDTGVTLTITSGGNLVIA